MSTIIHSELLECNYSYQHLQGEMLVNFNRLASDLRLSHAEYRLMCVLIGFWNKNSKRAFPTIKMLSEISRMSNSTIIKGLNNLVKAGLIIIIKDNKFKRNNYYLNTKKLLNDKTRITPEVTRPITPCGNSMINIKKLKQINKKTPFSSNKKLLYLASFKYWLHKPTGKKFLVKPSIGQHVLYQYLPETNAVHIFEDNITDSIENFEGINDIKLTPKNNQKRPDKQELVKILIKQGHADEAQKLATLFKINFDNTKSQN